MEIKMKVKTEFASEMDRLDAQLSASLRETIETDPELLAKIMGTFGPLVKKKK